MFNSPLAVHLRFILEEMLVFVEDDAVSQDHVVGEELPNSVIFVL